MWLFIIYNVSPTITSMYLQVSVGKFAKIVNNKASEPSRVKILQFNN